MIVEIGKRNNVEVTVTPEKERFLQSIYGPRGGYHGSQTMVRSKPNRYTFDWKKHADLFILAKSSQKSLWKVFHAKFLLAKAKEGRPRASLTADEKQKYFDDLDWEEIKALAAVEGISCNKAYEFE